ncbi:hypothetical protein D9758_013756 [Tetrapyrgos nigripes]|uniref:Uncharacterized protein n=1 Tax=Tetrapyrgos nigripes TaxID=182062 RepID=A0A8H5G1N9_9AGAR|nr:hypothetical protein D9758_013756 [Tetrapyrgos nigripes]
MSQAQQQSFPLASSDLYVMRAWILETAVQWLFYGVNGTLALAVFYVVFSQPQHPTRPQLILLVLVALMLILSMADMVLNLLYNLIQIPLEGYNATSLADKIILQSGNMQIAVAMFSRINFVIGDGIVIWRAWILFPRNLIVKGMLTICILASLCGTFVDAGVAAARLLHQVADKGAKTRILVMVLPLLFTNTAATSLIGYKAW